MEDILGGENSQLKINPLDYQSIKCECGCELFEPAVVFKAIPGVLLGISDQKEVSMPIKVFKCSKCGKLFKDDEKMLYDNNKEKKSNLII